MTGIKRSLRQNRSHAFEFYFRTLDLRHLWASESLTIGVGAFSPWGGGAAMNQWLIFSETFYRRHAEASHGFVQSVYGNVSHPGLNGVT